MKTVEYIFRGLPGSEPIQKFWGTFLCPNNFGILGRKGGGWPIPKVLVTFSPNFWCIMTQKVPQKFQKKIWIVPKGLQSTNYIQRSDRTYLNLTATSRLLSSKYVLQTG